MKFFLDTEFIEDGKTIDLVSIGLVCEDGSSYYAISTDFDPSKADPWVVENVLKKLPPIYWDESDNPENLITQNWEPYRVNKGDPNLTEEEKKDILAWRSREQIAFEVVGGIKGRCVNKSGWSVEETVDIFHDKDRLWKLELDKEPEIWAYYADYDWVVLCQLFGTMMDLPKGFPMYCRDIKQECDRLGNPELPAQGEDEHSAIADAFWNKKAWEFLRDFEAAQGIQESLNLI